MVLFKSQKQRHLNIVTERKKCNARTWRPGPKQWLVVGVEGRVWNRPEWFSAGRVELAEILKVLGFGSIGIYGLTNLSGAGGCGHVWSFQVWLLQGLQPCFPAGHPWGLSVSAPQASLWVVFWVVSLSHSISFSQLPEFWFPFLPAFPSEHFPVCH